MRPADELGPILASRGRALDLRRRLEAELAAAGEAVIDFEGVDTMTPSFADEFIAKLPADARDRLRFEHLDEDLRALIDAVSAGRALA